MLFCGNKMKVSTTIKMLTFLIKHQAHVTEISTLRRKDAEEYSLFFKSLVEIWVIFC